MIPLLRACGKLAIYPITKRIDLCLGHAIQIISTCLDMAVGLRHTASLDYRQVRSEQYHFQSSYQTSIFVSQTLLTGIEFV